MDHQSEEVPRVPELFWVSNQSDLDVLETLACAEGRSMAISELIIDK
jgi:hypothetical protein